MRRRRNPIDSLFGPSPLAFCLRAGVLLVLLAALSITDSFHEWFVRPLIEWNAVATAGVLRLLGCTVLRSGAFIHSADSGAFGIEVIGECTGIHVLGILVSLTLAFPASWRSRLGGLALGVALILALNIVRLVSLFLLGRRFPGYFHEIHVYVWQGLLIALVVFYWYAWARRSGRRVVPAEA